MAMLMKECPVDEEIAAVDGILVLESLGHSGKRHVGSGAQLLFSVCLAQA